MFRPSQPRSFTPVRALFVGATLLAGVVTGHSTANAATAVRGAAANRPALPHALAAECLLNQQQWVGDGSSVAFGADTVLSQTFKPSRSGRVCKVEVRLRRNTTAGVGRLKLSVLTMAGGVLDSAAVGAPPVGDSTVTFDLGCDGGALTRELQYRVQLESPTSLLGSYAWRGNNLNPYGRGQGQQRAGLAAWGPVGAGTDDFMFRIYLCQ